MENMSTGSPCASAAQPITAHATTAAPSPPPSPSRSLATGPDRPALPPHRRRRPSFGPLPDLRFEQSYRASIAHAHSPGAVALITIRDQLLLPFLQGSVWSLALLGWAHWNKTTSISGSSVGARARRWWYRTNNWEMPDTIRDFGGNAELAASVGDNHQRRTSCGS
ncbi:hypothetical protein K3495_g2598 [Podosphaera aphanis]|nr:hypothetical protein K3495_g2598 [Podosphaera aphanis]